MTYRYLALFAALAAASACSSGDAGSADGTAPSNTVASAAAQAPGEARFFELRTYTTHPGKLPDLDRRFRDHTTRLFEKHGMTNVGYWMPQDSALRDNTLVYILAYPSQEAREQSWVAFREDPEWQTARAASEEAGPIVERVVSVFMTPTDYSLLR
jgi:hypothetical protein